MASSVSSARESRSTHNSLAGSNNSYALTTAAAAAVINKDSKARHILGLSRTELHGARTESLTSKSTSTVNETSSVDRSSIRNRFARHIRNPIGVFKPDIKTKPNPGVSEILLGSESDKGSESHTASLISHPSTSTLRSIHEATTSPTIVSQTTSNTSNTSAIESTQPVSASVMPHATDQDMDYTRQRRYFRSPRLRSIREGGDFDKDVLDFESDTDSSPQSSGSSLNYYNRSPGVTRVQLLSSPPRPTAPLSSYQGSRQPVNHREPRTTLRKKNNPHEPLKGLAVNTPYVKVHVRRPKAGTKNWFDDLEGVSSDEDNEENYDFEVEPRFDFVEDNFVFESDRTETPRPITNRSKPSPDKKQMQVQIIEDPESSPEIDLTSFRLVTQRDTSRKNSSLSLSGFSTQSNPLVKADLSQESVLNLSLSDDEEDDEVFLPPLQPRQSTELHRTIRQSVVDACNDDSDVEVSLAQAVRTVGRTPGKRPSPIQIVSLNESNPFSPSPLTASPWRFGPQFDPLRSASMLSDISELKDIDEDILLKSFPATPTDANRPRSSVSLSDDKNNASMRLMKVTRQEENLIAAMRMKRAAMKRAEKAAARSKSPKVQAEISTIPTRQPSLAEQSLYSPEGDRPVTAFVPDCRGRGSSEIPLLVEFQDRIQRGDYSPAYHRRRTSGNSMASYGPFPRMPSGFASPTSPDPQQRDTNLVFLDNLNAELPRTTFPAQVYLESPFGLWDKSESPVIQ